MISIPLVEAIAFHRFKPIAGNELRYILSVGLASPYLPEQRCLPVGELNSMDFGFTDSGQEPVGNEQQESPRTTDLYARQSEDGQPNTRVGIVDGRNRNWTETANSDVHRQCNGEDCDIQ
jgi:hypothetical protein